MSGNRQSIHLWAFCLFALLGCGPAENGIGVAGNGGDSGAGGRGGAVPRFFPCTEQGVRDAVAEGGGPHFFACSGPTTVALEAPLVIDQDVVLDGEGTLILDGNELTPMLEVTGEGAAELRRLELTNATITFTEHTVLNAGTLTLTGSVLSIHRIDNQGALTLAESTWNPRVEWESAGSVISNVGSATVTSCAFSGTHISNYGTATVSDSTFSGASTPLDEIALVGIFNRRGGTVTLVNSTISGSELIGLENEGAMTVTRSTITGNGRLSFWGGGIDNLAGTLSLANSTVSGNTSTLVGGIYVRRGVVEIANSTVSSNTVRGNLFSPARDNGSIWSENGTVRIAGSVIDGDCGEASNGITSMGYNIESPGNTCGFEQASDQVSVGVDALKLDPLAYNGGTTPTHALRAGSVAIDSIPAQACLDAAGEPLAEDQRGEARPSGAMCDAGAFEAQSGE